MKYGGKSVSRSFENTSNDEQTDERDYDRRIVEMGAIFTMTNRYKEKV